VHSAHHVHVWQLDENSTLLESHIVIEKEDVSEMEFIKASIKKTLQNNFGIHHSTLEFEFEPCGEQNHGAVNGHQHQHDH